MGDKKGFAQKREAIMCVIGDEVMMPVCMQLHYEMFNACACDPRLETMRVHLGHLLRA